MLPLILTLIATTWLLILAPTVTADDTVHAAVIYMRSGERTPVLRSYGESQTLSALGARQIFSLGQNFRGRYINGLSGHIGLGQSQIPGLSPNILNDGDVYIMTRQDPYLMASAQAFMQGFYPAYSIGGTNGTGRGNGDERGILSNGSAIDFPLGGYQYPRIRAAGQHDPYRIYVSGNLNCPVAAVEGMQYYTTPDFQDTFNSAEPTYGALPPSIFDDLLGVGDVNYHQAYLIHDFLSYEYTHNTAIYNLFDNSSTYTEIYNQLAQLANTQEWNLWGSTTTSSSFPSSPSSSNNNNMKTIAAKTLSALILGQFQNTVENAYNASSSTESYPLTFLFGDHEPFLSAFALFELDALNANFKSIPPYGAAMIFELVSLGQNTGFPADKNDLYVRFRYQNGTGFDGEEPRQYPLFARQPNRMDMEWSEFEARMSAVMVNSMGDWCEKCDSGALFCWGVDDGMVVINSLNRRRGRLSNAVAGVIGAVVTLVVAGLVFGLVMFFAGVRLRRERPRSGLGGFKGSDKLASDADLSLPRHAEAMGAAAVVGGGNGNKAPTERIGSWELRQKEDARTGVGMPESRGSFDEIEAAAAAAGLGRPVLPVDRV